MRAFLTAVLTTLAVAGGASLKAEAAPAGDLRGAGADIGTHKEASLPLVRASYEDDDEMRPSRRWRRDGRSWHRPRHARHQHAKQRYARHARRGWSRIARASDRARLAQHGRRGARHARAHGRLPVRSHPVQHLAIGADILGLASFYWQGQRTATGERFNPNGMTAAHRTLPFGTKVRVTHLGSGRSVVVRINDRGPFIAGRIIDLSRGAAGVLGMQGQGVARVRVTVLGR